jgi:hypothetical protein
VGSAYIAGGVSALLLHFVCAIVLMYDAFYDAPHKIVIGLLWPRYFWAFGWPECEHDYKNLLLAGYWVGELAGIGLIVAGIMRGWQ